ncbi:hypothetical protein [Eisenbergiella tayi]|uniref:hypothetical protein n=1 Tax=Eisenbergiella tayi TaxID=1432052 RepID=UPI0004711B9D|nr:hypothetical protein [Eisenbergiella tayi]
MDRLKDFRYRNVELKNSLWERQRRETAETYLAIPNDSLLYYFRTLAGLEAPGEGLTAGTETEHPPSGRSWELLPSFMR